MEGHLYDGDIIILFNDEDVTGCTARQLTMMIAETSDVTKKFTVLSNTGPVRFQGAEYVNVNMLYVYKSNKSICLCQRSIIFHVVCLQSEIFLMPTSINEKHNLHNVPR